jgi:hypothetical protein
MAKYGGIGKTKPAKPVKTAPKALDPHNHDWELHEEDRKAMHDGVNYGLAHAAEFVEQADVDLVELIATYSDAEAQAKLDALRERFWSGVWVPAARSGSPGSR